MRTSYIIIMTLLSVFSNSCQQPSKPFLTEEEKETCISVFEGYLSVDKEAIDTHLETTRTILSSNGISASEIEATISEIAENTKHVNAVLEECIELVKKGEATPAIELLEKERFNIYGHPANDTYTCLDLHIAMAMLYSASVETEEEYISKWAELLEYNRLHIEAVQANHNQIHPDYEYVLSELYDAYDILGREKERQEVEEILYQLLSEE